VSAAPVALFSDLFSYCHSSWFLILIGP